MNDVATQVVETGRIIMQKDAEKKIFPTKFKSFRNPLLKKKKKLNVFVQAKNELEELAIKVEAQREENDFLRSFLNSAVENKFEEFDLYRTFVTETREFFVNTLQEIKDTLKQKGRIS
ncbi:uncharacterized protein CEXT_780431 [Caerostris extrusa]|uniref:Uncharacterized protein n=1 Tax=Caerostris extrusa TaxID=172846 RepID=A0AAV4P563_CAEEX|nr:uncharacterized protein CEXT_780431 [Caerostris extrusa]